MGEGFWARRPRRPPPSHPPRTPIHLSFPTHTPHTTLTPDTHARTPHPPAPQHHRRRPKKAGSPNSPLSLHLPTHPPEQRCYGGRPPSSSSASTTNTHARPYSPPFPEAAFDPSPPHSLCNKPIKKGNAHPPSLLSTSAAPTAPSPPRGAMQLWILIPLPASSSTLISNMQLRTEPRSSSLSSLFRA